MPVHFDDGFEAHTPVYTLDALSHTTPLKGPALLIDPNFTVVLPRVASVSLTAVGDLDIVLDGSLFA